MSFTSDYAEVEPTRAEVDAIAGSLVVEFGAPWCPHCLAIQEKLAELMEARPEVGHIKIYDGRGQPLGRSFRVKLWPTLICMREGEIVARLVRPSDMEMHVGLAACGEKR